MALVTVDEVNDIIETALDVTPFIETADLIVSESLVGKGLSDARLKQVELWLSAHFVTMREEKGGLRSSKIGDASDAFTWTRGKGLLATRYGQQALVLDTSGVLKSLNTGGKPSARFTIV